jgi:hypothetical protein
MSGCVASSVVMAGTTAVATLVASGVCTTGVVATDGAVEDSVVAIGVGTLVWSVATDEPVVT